MSKKRTFWAKMNLDEARESIEIMDDSEVGRWFRSWIIGAGGKEIPADRMQSWTLEQRAGYASGVLAFADAKSYSQKQRDRVSHRYTGKLPEATTVYHGSDPVAISSTGSLPTNREQRTENIEQRTESKDTPKAPSRGIPFSPEMFDHLIPEGFKVSPMFLVSWHDWMQDRKDRKKQITQRAANEQLRKLMDEARNPHDATAWIKNSIACGWQGIFKPKDWKSTTAGLPFITSW